MQAGTIPFALNDYTRLGQQFVAMEAFNLLWLTVPSWNDDEGGFTLSLWDSPRRAKQLASGSFDNIPDNSRVTLILPKVLPAGTYYWEIHDRSGRSRVGLYAVRNQARSRDIAYLDGKPDASYRFLFGVQYSPYVGMGRRRSWTARTKSQSTDKREVPLWIWYPETPVSAWAQRYFRHRFILPQPIRSAKVIVTGDDSFVLWVNGQEVARGGQPWLREVDITSLLQPGHNVLAASVHNAIAPAGLLLDLRIQYIDGKTQRLFSDTRWRCAREAPTEWLLPEFDDSRWALAVEQGDVFSGPWYGTGNIAQYYPLERSAKELDLLRREPPAKAEVRTVRGAPRLYVNGRWVFPFLAWSNDLMEFAPDFTWAGINLLHPHFNLADGWREDGKHDWHGFVNLLTRLLEINPKAFFLVRLGLFAPEWWKDQHPKELIGYALAVDGRAAEFSGVRHPSFVSQLWRRDVEAVLRQFLRYVEGSPLRSRVIGYQIANGIYGEWHYFGARYLPDTSPPMQKACGGVPDAKARMNTSAGLFRDPAKEGEVIRFYQRFHEVCADTILHFARIVKQETKERVLCGAFYTYLLENLWIQEGGHLAPERILRSKHIDFVACPYAYQGDAQDVAGNWLGRSRGLAGDGGYRVLLESIKRHGKLYFAEIDPSTCLETQPEQIGVGGTGNETLRGSRLILRRDLAHMLAQGNAGWLFDIGPGWYADGRLLEEIREFVRLGERQAQWRLDSVAQVAAIYDPRSFFVTAHWKAAPGEGEYDLFGDYFLNRQARALHRLGAPVDFLDIADLRPSDARRYRVLYFVNCFYLTDEQFQRLHALLRGTGVTALWCYAPGFVSPNGLSKQRVEALVGMGMRLIHQRGEMIVEASGRRFGVPGKHFPRFAVEDTRVDALGRWTDGAGVAFARKKVGGYTSVYVGTAPIPVELLRAIAKAAGVQLWSSHPDIVYATRDCVAVTATSDGSREIRLLQPLKRWGGDVRRKREYRLQMQTGETIVFVP